MTQKVVVADHGEAENAIVYLFNKKENELGYRVLLATTDHAVSLIQFPGRIMWSREEALADVTAVDVVELPFSPSQQNFETLQEEFGVHYINSPYIVIIMHVVGQENSESDQQ